MVPVNGEMTKKETDLLCENFPFDEESIKNGELSDAQRSALNELRLGTNLIESKYPKLSYEITSFAPATKMNGQAILNIKVEGDVKEYKTYVIYNNSGDPEVAETVYGSVIRQSYDDYICSILESNGIDAQSFTSFETPVRNEVNKDTVPEEIIDMKSNIIRYTDIFIEDNGWRQKTVDTIKDIMNTNGIYAVYEIDFVEGVSDQDARELESRRKEFVSISFECAEE